MLVAFRELGDSCNCCVFLELLEVFVVFFCGFAVLRFLRFSLFFAVFRGCQRLLETCRHGVGSWRLMEAARGL